MSRILYDFKCSDCGHVQEELVHSTVHEVMCDLCSAQSTRQISTPTIALDGTDPGFPDAYEKWGRQHEKAGKSKTSC